MKMLSLREKILISIACFMIIIFLSYKYAGKVSINIFNNTISSFNNNMIEVTYLKDLVNNMEEKNIEVLELNNNIEQLNKIIPDWSDVPGIIVDLKSILDISGCSMGKVTFEDNRYNERQNVDGTIEIGDFDNEEDNLKTLSLVYEIEGNYNCIMSFIDNVENNERKMVIEKLSIMNNPSENRVLAIITINCFYSDKKF